MIISFNSVIITSWHCTSTHQNRRKEYAKQTQSLKGNNCVIVWDMDSTTRQAEKKGNNPTGKGGFGDNPQNINPKGEPKNSMKNYVARKLAEMSDEEKDKWLKTHDIKGEVQWKMGEGNPHQSADETVTVILPKPLLGGESHGSNHDRNQEATQTKEE